MTQTKVNPDPRVEYIAGLRMLADLLEARPDLELPFDGSGGEMTVFVTRQDGQKERMAAWSKALPGRKDKRETGSNGELLSMRARLRGLNFQVIADRNEVCERVVVGTKTETKTVKDPALLAEVPEVEVTEEVEIVEWHCNSILAGAAS